MVQIIWFTEPNKKRRLRAMGGGGKYKLRLLEAKLFVYLFYCRHYTNQQVVAGLCGLNQSNISRLFKKLECILAKAADPNLYDFLKRIKRERKNNGLTFKELEILYPEIRKVITDATEILCNHTLFYIVSL